MKNVATGGPGDRNPATLRPHTDPSTPQNETCRVMTNEPQPDHYGPLRARIEALWEERDTLSPLTGGEDRLAIETALNELDSGRLRVAERASSHHVDDPGTHEPDESWLVNVWLKQAVLMSFRLTNSTLVPGSGGAPVYDKIPMKFHHWGANRFAEADFRVVPGAVVRRSAYIAPGVRADAVLCECRRLYRSRHDDRYLGDRGQLRANRPQLSH